MKVHGKTSPLPEDYDSDDDCHSNEESMSSPTDTKPNLADISTPNNTNQQTSNTSSPPLTVNPHPGLGETHSQTKFSEWYVCQSAGGMPTPPSNEHSPIGGLGNHMHSHLSALHPPSLVQYS